MKTINIDGTQVSIKLVAGIIGVLITFILLLKNVEIVDEHESGLITHLGVIDRPLNTGVNWKVPFLESFHVVTTKTQTYDVNTQVATKGGSNIVGIDFTLSYTIHDTPEVVTNLYKQFGSSFNYETRIMKKLAVDRLKTIVSQYPIEDITTKRGVIRQKVEALISQDIKDYGIIVKEVQLADIQFPHSYTSRLGELNKARAESAKAIEFAKKERAVAERTIIKTKVDAEKLIIEREAKATAVKLEAEAKAYAIKTKTVEEAEAIKRLGYAEAASIKAKNKALKDSRGIIEYKKIEVALAEAKAKQKWTGNVPTTVMNMGSNGSNMGIYPFMNMNKMIGDNK